MVLEDYVPISGCIGSGYNGNNANFICPEQPCPARMLVLCCPAQYEGRNLLGAWYQLGRARPDVRTRLDGPPGWAGDGREGHPIGDRPRSGRRSRSLSRRIEIVPSRQAAANRRWP